MSRTILICIVLTLATIGLIMLDSASMVRGDTQYDNSAHFVVRQLHWLFLSLAAAIVSTRIDLRSIHKVVLPATTLCVLLLVRIPGVRTTHQRQLEAVALRSADSTTAFGVC